jgi:hypothetical protein
VNNGAGPEPQEARGGQKQRYEEEEPNELGTLWLYPLLKGDTFIHTPISQKECPLSYDFPTVIANLFFLSFFLFWQY